jgi:hypothetical protein
MNWNIKKHQMVNELIFNQNSHKYLRSLATRKAVIPS